MIIPMEGTDTPFFHLVYVHNYGLHQSESSPQAESAEQTARRKLTRPYFSFPCKKKLGSGYARLGLYVVPMSDYKNKIIILTVCTFVIVNDNKLRLI